MSNLPANITLPYPSAYQVRIVRDGKEISAVFSIDAAASDGRERALAAAVEWRDAMLAQLPPPENGRGSYRTIPMPHKRTFGRVGVTRYVGVDRRRVGSPRYVRYGVNWTDAQGVARIKQFQAGRVDEQNWELELRAAMSAEAFREHWEHCKASGKPFDPEPYRAWRTEQLYPFDPA